MVLVLAGGHTKGMLMSLLEVFKEQTGRDPTQVLSPTQIFFFYITRTPRVIQKSMRLKYEPASEPLHISVE